MTPRRADACALLVLALLATAFFADVLVGVNGLYLRDLTRYFYPIKQSLRQIVQHGEFPYWNPSFSAGQPLAANPQQEVFYPPTWLILLPSYDLGFRSLLLLHVYIGLFAMYALLRSMDLRPFAATVGALGWGLGGIYLSYLNLLPILFCAAWLPVTCLFARRFLLRPQRPRLRRRGDLSRPAAPGRRADDGPPDRPPPGRVRALPRLVCHAALPADDGAGGLGGGDLRRRPARRGGAGPAGDRSRPRLGALAPVRFRPGQHLEPAVGAARRARLSEPPRATSPSTA